MTHEILLAGFGGQGILFSGKFLAYDGLIEELDEIYDSNLKATVCAYTTYDEVSNETLSDLNNIKQILELLENYRTYTKEIIDTVSAKYSVCSYELSLELSEWCELIVCDYNYLFDLQVYLRRYFTSPDANYIFLIDEAHNLVDRACTMYSAELIKEEILTARRQVKDRYNGAEKAFSKTSG